MPKRPARAIEKEYLVKVTAEELDILTHLERPRERRPDDPPGPLPMEGKAGTFRRALRALYDLDHDPRIAVVSLRKPPFLPDWVSRAPTTITRATKTAEQLAAQGFEVRVELLTQEPPLPIVEPELRLGPHFEGDDDP